MYKQLIPLLIANTIPLIGVFVFGWESISVFGLYILETVILGLFHALKMFILAKLNLTAPSTNNPTNTINNSVGCLIPFFLFHFMFFVFVQTVLVFGFAGAGNQSFFYGFRYLANLTQGETGLALAAFALINTGFLVDDLVNAKEKYAYKSLEKIMMEPYPRIIIQQFVVIIGGGIIMITSSSKSLVLIFVIVKVLAEIVLIYKDNPKLKAYLESKSKE